MEWLFRKRLGSVHIIDVIVPLIVFFSALIFLSAEKALIITLGFFGFALFLIENWSHNRDVRLWIVAISSLVISLGVTFLVKMPEKFKAAAAFIPLISLWYLVKLYIFKKIRKAKT